MSEGFRRTGRTKRMLACAIELARNGRAVYVVCADQAQARVIAAYARALGVDPAGGIKFETPASLPTFDLETMRMRSAHPNCVVLVDHWAIERRYAAMLEELHRYDAEADPSGNPG